MAEENKPEEPKTTSKFPWQKPVEEKKIVDGVYVDDYPENEKKK